MTLTFRKDIIGIHRVFSIVMMGVIAGVCISSLYVPSVISIAAFAVAVVWVFVAFYGELLL